MWARVSRHQMDRLSGLIIINVIIGRRRQIRTILWEARMNKASTMIGTNCIKSIGRTLFIDDDALDLPRLRNSPKWKKTKSVWGSEETITTEQNTILGTKERRKKKAG
jgi:hypothetical protein